jgi:hypothetical protein
MTNFKKIIVGMEVVVIGALSLASWQAAFGGHERLIPLTQGDL